MATLAKVVQLISDKHSSDLHERNAVEIERLYETRSTGFHIVEVGGLVQILEHCRRVLASGEALFENPTVLLLQACAIPLIPDFSHDLAQLPQCLDDILTAVASILNTVNMPRISQTAVETLGALVDHIISQGTIDESGQIKNIPFTLFPLLCNRDMIVSLNTELKRADGSAANEDRLLSVVRILKYLSALQQPSDIITNCGLLETIVSNVICPMDFRSLTVSLAVEVLWNCLERCDAARAHLGTHNSLAGLNALVCDLLSQGYRLKDKHLRNDVLVVLMLIVNDSATHTAFISSGCLTTCVLHSVSVHFPHSPDVIKAFAQTTTGEDLEMRRAMWSLIFQVAHHRDAVPILEQAQLVKVLIDYCDEQCTAPAITKYARNQRRELAAMAMNTLTGIMDVPRFNSQFTKDEGGLDVCVELMCNPMALTGPGGGERQQAAGGSDEQSSTTSASASLVSSHLLHGHFSQLAHPALKVALSACSHADPPRIDNTELDSAPELFLNHDPTHWLRQDHCSSFIRFCRLVFDLPISLHTLALIRDTASLLNTLLNPPFLLSPMVPGSALPSMIRDSIANLISVAHSHGILESILHVLTKVCNGVEKQNAVETITMIGSCSFALWSFISCPYGLSTPDVDINCVKGPWFDSCLRMIAADGISVTCSVLERYATLEEVYVPALGLLCDLLRVSSARNGAPQPLASTGKGRTIAQIDDSLGAIETLSEWTSSHTHHSSRKVLVRVWDACARKLKSVTEAINGPSALPTSDQTLSSPPTPVPEQRPLSSSGASVLPPPVTGRRASWQRPMSASLSATVATARLEPSPPREDTTSTSSGTRAVVLAPQAIDPSVETDTVYTLHPFPQETTFERLTKHKDRSDSSASRELVRRQPSDVRSKVFSLFRRIGFVAPPNVPNDLDTQERLILALIQEYASLREEEAWRNISVALARDNIRPVSADQQKLDQHREALAKKTSGVVQLQAQITEDQQRAELAAERELYERAFRMPSVADKSRSWVPVVRRPRNKMRIDASSAPLSPKSSTEHDD